MPDIDGRKIGATGEHRGDATPDKEIDTRRVSIDGEVESVECVRTSEVAATSESGWRCDIDNGRRQSYRESTPEFHELDISGAEDEEYREHGDLHVLFDFPSGGRCEIETTPYAHVDQERTLRCSSR